MRCDYLLQFAFAHQFANVAGQPLAHIPNNADHLGAQRCQQFNAGQLNLTIAMHIFRRWQFVYFHAFFLEVAACIVQTQRHQRLQIHASAIGMTEFRINNCTRKTLAKHTLPVSDQQLLDRTVRD